MGLFTQSKTVLKGQLSSIELFLDHWKDLLRFFVNIQAENGISGFLPDSWRFSQWPKTNSSMLKLLKMHSCFRDSLCKQIKVQISWRKKSEMHKYKVITLWVWLEQRRLKMEQLPLEKETKISQWGHFWSHRWWKFSMRWKPQNQRRE